MDINLTPGAISKLLKDLEWKSMVPVLQVRDIVIAQTQTRAVSGRVENKDGYMLILSDGSKQRINAFLAPQVNELVRSKQLQKGSVIQLSKTVCNWVYQNIILVIMDVHVIIRKCDIIGDSKQKEGHAYNHVAPASKYIPMSYEARRKMQEKHKQPSFSADTKDTYNVLKMMWINSEDVRLCIEKLDKLGWRTKDAKLYTTALSLFAEGADNRKFWLQLEPESCEYWVRDAGYKFGPVCL